ncbi:MAG: hypothetical protein K2L18_06430 [Acetatifactor sp.]|nr:hypothetical protein [Acetatifactor sp.]
MKTALGFELARMKEVDVHTVDRDSLVDIREVQIDGNLPREQRFEDFLRQIRNPYCYRCGKIVVKISFSDTDVTLEDRLEHYLATL